MPSAMSTKMLPVVSTWEAIPLKKFKPNPHDRRTPPKARPALILNPIVLLLLERHFDWLQIELHHSASMEIVFEQDLQHNTKHAVLSVCLNFFAVCVGRRNQLRSELSLFDAKGKTVDLVEGNNIYFIYSLDCERSCNRNLTWLIFSLSLHPLTLCLALCPKADRQTVDRSAAAMQCRCFFPRRRCFHLQPVSKSGGRRRRKRDYTNHFLVFGTSTKKIINLTRSWQTHILDCLQTTRSRAFH